MVAENSMLNLQSKEVFFSKFWICKVVALQINVTYCFILFYIFFSFVFLGPHAWHMEVPRPGV